MQPAYRQTGRMFVVGMLALACATLGSAQQTSPDGYRPQSAVNGVPVTTTPRLEDAVATLDALPEAPVVKPRRERRVLIFCRATGYAHSVIPLAAFAVQKMGERTGAFRAEVSYDLKDISAANLARFDAVVLNNTTGAFLDDDDANATAARRAALLDFVRRGHGLVLLHAATAAYRDAKTTWPDYTRMTGGLFKWHWLYPQQVTVKFDDPRNPINAAFGGRAFTIHDEIYTFAMNSFSRSDTHVLMTMDYGAMSPADRDKEPVATRRTDKDYPLGWVRREGRGRVFYEALGHSEHIYAMPAMLRHMLAGIQYATGDLSVDDRPSRR